MPLLSASQACVAHQEVAEKFLNAGGTVEEPRFSAA
jgi:hypothetical protein